MSQREKPADPQPYYEAHVFCCTNRRAGRPSARLLRGEGQRGVARLHEEPRQGARPQERAHQQCRLPRPLRTRADGGDLSRRRLVLGTTKEDIDEVLQKHLVKGGRVERLMLQTADKLAEADRVQGRKSLGRSPS